MPPASFPMPATRPDGIALTTERWPPSFRCSRRSRRPSPGSRRSSNTSARMRIRGCRGDEERVSTVLSYSHGWANNPDVIELARTFPRRVGETLRSLIRAA
jgi:hypothetical protein